MEDTFVKIVTKKPAFYRGSSFKTWLYAIAGNIARDWLRTVGTGYVLAASLGIIDDFLGIFRNRTDAPLSTNQQQFFEDAVADIGESISCNGYTVTAQGAFTDGTVAYVLVDVEAPESVAIDGLGIALILAQKK